MFFTATKGARLLVGALLLWVISKTDKAGIHAGELLKFFIVTCCVFNCISSIPESTGIILSFVLVSSSSKKCSSDPFPRSPNLVLPNNFLRIGCCPANRAIASISRSKNFLKGTFEWLELLYLTHVMLSILFLDGLVDLVGVH